MVGRKKKFRVEYSHNLNAHVRRKHKNICYNGMKVEENPRYKPIEEIDRYYKPLDFRKRSELDYKNRTV